MEINENLTIEKVKECHVGQIAEIEQESFSDPWSHDALLYECENKLAHFHAAVIDGQVVGYFGLHIVIDEGYITNIAVRESYRGQGIAKSMMSKMLELASQHKLCSLTLEVRASNQPAISLYRRFGFQSEGLRKGFYTLPADDAIIMTRRFSQKYEQ